MALVHPAGFANYFFATTGTMLIRIRTDADRSGSSKGETVAYAGA